MTLNPMKRLLIHKLWIPLITSVLCLTLFFALAWFTYQAAIQTEKEKALDAFGKLTSHFVSIVTQQIEKAQSVALLKLYAPEEDIPAYTQQLYRDQQYILTGWMMTEEDRVILADTSNLSQTKLGTRLSDDPAHSEGIQRALKTRRVVLMPVHVIQDKLSASSTVNGYVPIFNYENNLPKDVEGVIVIVMNIDRLLGQSGLLSTTRNYQIALVKATATDKSQQDAVSTVFFNTFKNGYPSSSKVDAAVSYSVELANANWTFFALPISGWKPDLTATGLILITGVALSLLAYAYLRSILLSQDHLNHQVEERTNQLKDINAELEASLESLSLAQDQLIRSEKLASLGELIAGVAHEINTPLGISVTVSSYLKDRYEEVHHKYTSGQLTKDDFAKFMEGYSEGFESLESALQRVVHIVTSFKILASDQTHLEAQTIKLNDFLAELHTALLPKLAEGGHRLTIACPEDFEVFTLPGALTHILTNLVTNSLLHGFDGLEGGEITLRVTPSPQSFCIDFSDNGWGIPPELVNRVFDPFFTTKRIKGCVGLGLHVVNNMVTQVLKGELTLSPQSPEATQSDRQGTLVTMCFPNIFS